MQPTHTELLRLVCPLCACLCLLHEGEHDICLVDELDVIGLVGGRKLIMIPFLP